MGAQELAEILTYPRYSEQEHLSRVEELRSLGVSQIILGGRTLVSGLRIAGKGQVGLVVKAVMAGKGRETCALKIRRMDANRPDMQAEARLHRIANGAGVGPALYDYSSNFMLMEFAEGEGIVDWAAAGDGLSAGREQAQSVAASVLEQCYLLDRAGIDHGELSRVDRHVIVCGKKATIIDFESASTERKKMCNVSAAGQSLFVSGPVAGSLAKVMPHVDRQAAISALKKYKWDQSRANFESLLALVGA